MRRKQRGLLAFAPLTLTAFALAVAGCGEEEGPAFLTPEELQAKLLEWEQEAPQRVKDEIAWLRRPDPSAKAHAAIRLAHMGDLAEGSTKGAILALIQTLEDDSELEWVPTNIIGEPKYTPPFFPGQKGSTSPGREAMVALSWMHKEAVQPLVLALKKPNPLVRCRAAEALGRIKDDRAIEPLVAALKDAESSVRETAAKALYFADDRAVEPLIQALKDAEPEVRAAAATALGSGRKQDVRGVEALITALRDSAPCVRDASADSLSWIKNDCAMAALIGALNDKEGGQRLSAAKALKGTQDDKAVQALVAALKHQDRDLQVVVADALGTIKDPRAIKALMDAFRDEDGGVQAAAEEASVRLSHIQGEGVRAALIRALKDPDRRVRLCAARVLVKIAGVEPLAAGLRACGEDSDAKFIINDALRTMTGESFQDSEDWLRWWQQRGKK